MGTIFFIVLVIAEIALIALTFTKFTEKAAWLKNRLLTTLCETVLLAAIAALPTTNMKWRFAAAIIILVIRLIIEGIVFLAKRKKEGKKNRAAAVFSGILAVIIVGLALVPAFMFTNYNGLPATGEYNVETVSSILVDGSRKDPFETDGSNREVPAYFFYPECDGGEFPLVIFSHGAFGYYQSNMSTYTELASHGYIVVSLDHPHHSFFTTDTNGQTITVDSKFINDVMRVSSTDAQTEEDSNNMLDWINIRTADVNFVLDTIETAKKDGALSSAWHTDDEKTVLSVLDMTDVEKIGLMGHSLGGATSVEVGRERSDITAVVDIDGTMLGERTYNAGEYEYDSEPYPIALLDFTKTQDYNDREQYKNEHGYPYVNEYVTDNAKDAKTVMFSDAGHMDFTDLPLISPFLGSMLGSGTRDNAEMMNTVNSIILNWFDYYLKGEGALDIKAQY